MWKKHIEKAIQCGFIESWNQLPCWWFSKTTLWTWLYWTTTGPLHSKWMEYYRKKMPEWVCYVCSVFFADKTKWSSQIVNKSGYIVYNNASWSNDSSLPKYCNINQIFVCCVHYNLLAFFTRKAMWSPRRYSKWRFWVGSWRWLCFWSCSSVYMQNWVRLISTLRFTLHFTSYLYSTYNSDTEFVFHRSGFFLWWQFTVFLDCCSDTVPTELSTLQHPCRKCHAKSGFNLFTRSYELMAKFNNI